MVETMQAPTAEKVMRRDQSTGGRVDPEIREMVVDLLMRGTPKSHIVERIGMDFYTICAIELAAFPDIEQRRVNAANKAYTALTASLDSALDRAHKGLATAMDSKMLADAWRDLAGQAGAPINVVHHFPALDEWERGNEGAVIEQDDTGA